MPREGNVTESTNTTIVIDMDKKCLERLFSGDNVAPEYAICCRCGGIKKLEFIDYTEDTQAQLKIQACTKSLVA